MSVVQFGAMTQVCAAAYMQLVIHQAWRVAACGHAKRLKNIAYISPQVLVHFVSNGMSSIATSGAHRTASRYHPMRVGIRVAHAVSAAGSARYISGIIVSERSFRLMVARYCETDDQTIHAHQPILKLNR